VKDYFDGFLLKMPQGKNFVTFTLLYHLQSLDLFSPLSCIIVLNLQAKLLMGKLPLEMDGHRMRVFMRYVIIHSEMQSLLKLNIDLYSAFLWYRLTLTAHSIFAVHHGSYW
jgi:hypothetical protein